MGFNEAGMTKVEENEVIEKKMEPEFVSM